MKFCAHLTSGSRSQRCKHMRIWGTYPWSLSRCASLKPRLGLLNFHGGRMTLTLNRPWMTFDLGSPHRILSWAMNRPGYATSRHILWREVRNADLPPELDVSTWFAEELRTRNASDAIAFLTSRDIRAYDDKTVSAGDTYARCIATVGLSNAEHIGTRIDRSQKDWGTINIAVQVGCGLTDTALIEALAIATQARTRAVMSVGHMLPTGVATGTGTDCVAIAVPVGNALPTRVPTDAKDAVERCVYDAVAAGAQRWVETVKREEAP